MNKDKNEVINNFIRLNRLRAIYGDNADLALASVNEIEALKTATEKISELQSKLEYAEDTWAAAYKMGFEDGKDAVQKQNTKRKVNQYRRKPLIVEAVLYTGTDESYEEACRFCTGILLAPRGNGKFHIETPEVGHDVSPGDWIIKGIAGEYYSCKPELFVQLYEKAK